MMKDKINTIEMKIGTIKNSMNILIVPIEKSAF
jgi:hypothetical protein